MSYIVCHMKKMKYGALNNLCRESKDTSYRASLSRVDNSRITSNFSLISSSNYQNSFSTILSTENIERFRKNAVCLCSFVFSASPSFFIDKSVDEVKRYFVDCLEFISSRYGKSNIIDATVHLDEKTPHMHLELVPIVDDKKNGGKKLCCRDLFGNRRNLIKLQEDLFKFLVNEKGYDFEHHHAARDTNAKHIDNLEWTKGELTKKVTNLTFQADELQKKIEVLEKDNENILAPKDRELFICYNALSLVVKKLPEKLQKSFYNYFSTVIEDNKTTDKVINKLRSEFLEKIKVKGGVFR